MYADVYAVFMHKIKSKMTVRTLIMGAKVTISIKHTRVLDKSITLTYCNAHLVANYRTNKYMQINGVLENLFKFDLLWSIS